VTVFIILPVLIVGFYLTRMEYPPPVLAYLKTIKVKNIPLSADDGQIHRTLTLEDCNIEGIFREKLRVDGRLTNCDTGDRLVISKPRPHPLPRSLQIGKYWGRIFHPGQIETDNQNRKNIKNCHKGLKPGHYMYQCTSD
jgi:hypothetical protein